jgi:hypothetical protein
MLKAISEVPFILFKGDTLLGQSGEGKFAKKFMAS